MANPFLSRAWITAQVDDIQAKPAAHKEKINFLLKQQRVLSKFVMKEAAPLSISNTKILYISGVIARVFDLAGGRMDKVKAPALRGAEAQIVDALPKLLPIGEGFVDRVREVGWRAQPHLVDECMVSLFEDDGVLDPTEGAKILLTMWVVIEALDASWTPPPDFEGETDYTYVPESA